MDTAGVWSKVEGEAVGVDLGKGRWLIAPLRARFDDNGIGVFGVIGAEGDKRKSGSYSISSSAFWTWIGILKRERPYRLSKLTCADPFPTDANLNTMKFDQLRPTCPTLVTFGQIDKPDTIRIVDPNDLERVLGPGIRLRSIEVQMSDDSPTHAIHAVLPWLKSLKPEQAICRYDYAPSPYPPCAAFYAKDFARDD